MQDLLSPRRLTIRCGGRYHDTVHAPDCSASIEVSVRASHEWRPVADAGR
jgi:hypothetical protein